MALCVQGLSDESEDTVSTLWPRVDIMTLVNHITLILLWSCKHTGVLSCITDVCVITLKTDVLLCNVPYASVVRPHKVVPHKNRNALCLQLCCVMIFHPVISHVSNEVAARGSGRPFMSQLSQWCLDSN